MVFIVQQKAQLSLGKACSMLVPENSKCDEGQIQYLCSKKMAWSAMQALDVYLQMSAAC